VGSKALKYLKWLKQTRVNYNFDITGLQPFIFSESLGKENNPLSYEPNDRTILACPFPVFSIEIEGDNFLIHDEVSKVECILCHEITAGAYDFLLLGRSQKSDERMWLEIPTNHKSNHRVSQLIDVAISRIHAKAIGTKSNLAKIPYKNTSGQKKVFHPQKFIYVSSHAKATNQQVLSKGNNIKWSDKRSVMAHWRVLTNPESLGVNRSGERKVKGYTFVKNYEKGSGELVIKPRKVG